MLAGEEGGGPPSVLWVRPGASEDLLGPHPPSSLQPSQGLAFMFSSEISQRSGAQPHLCAAGSKAGVLLPGGPSAGAEG